MSETLYFEYGEKEKDYLINKDPILGSYIKKRGDIKRPVMPDLFQALVHTILGQQISTKAHNTVWERLNEIISPISPENIHQGSDVELQACGTSMRKIVYIKNAAEKIVIGDLNLHTLSSLPDEKLIKELTKLKGVGEWTAEILMLFSMQRMNVLSYKDLGIRRGISKLYNVKNPDQAFVEKCKDNYTPYSSVASLYLWEYSKL